MPSLEARAKDRVSQRYGKFLKQLDPWERKFLTLVEEVKIEDEKAASLGRPTKATG
jgi:hypothetical protein